MAFPYAAFSGPGYFIGRQISVFGVTGLTISAVDGTVTAGTQANLKLLGVLDEAKFQSHVTHEEISPCTQRVENYIIIAEGVTVDISEIMPIGARSNLFQLMLAYDYIRFAMTVSPTGSSSGTQSLTLLIDLVRGDGSLEFKRGKCVANLQLKSAGVGFTTATIV